MPKVTSKLQITLPKRIAEQHGIVPGDEIHFESTDSAIRIVSARSGSRTQLSQEERLRLFDEATARVERMAPQPPPTGGDKRDWTREDLYSRGEPD
ncbi:MAG: AbrB/MazE/SpoVT family DNA-binding domain-containing protein [Proteobacteria bacterium]|jgi:AbrB family looped-hinge helix DNA binding protein|nr:AbrB/MazE/SpoVT family DNA-binding domain-containing protein [Pseudomonadota bacterium]MDA1300239.1 AbrB/MazE/SpoVT family DNA-binding domain-containing protein [Pseudomonadota bacterium]